MDSQLSDTLACLQHAIWHRDWDDAQSIAGRLTSLTPPTEKAELGSLLISLRELSAAAKLARSDMNLSLNRLRLVAEFRNSAGGPFVCP